jgi:hypothetical protein
VNRLIDVFDSGITVVTDLFVGGVTNAPNLSRPW